MRSFAVDFTDVNIRFKRRAGLTALAFEPFGRTVCLGLMASKEQFSAAVKCELLAVSSQKFFFFFLALTDFCANEHVVNVIYIGFRFAGIWLQEFSSGILLVRSGFLRFLWLY